MIPKAIRERRQIEPGDDFEVSVDDEDADLILLRRIRSSANSGLVEHLAAVDSLLAATARRNQLTLATNNVADFRATGVRILNPFD